MQLDFFSRIYVRTDTSYENDMKLDAFLQCFFSTDAAIRLQSFFRYYCDRAEIERRQRFFYEVTENLKCRLLLKKIRAYYRPLENAVILYHKKTEKLDRDIWGVYLLNQYVLFIRRVLQEKNSIDVNLDSEIFQSFYLKIKYVYESKSFKFLCDHLAFMDKQYDDIKNVSVYAEYINALLVCYGIELGSKKNIIESIDTYLTNSDFDIETRKNIHRVSDLDLYGKYLNFIIEKFPEKCALVDEINRKFDNLIKIILDLNIDDILVALDCCELYDFFKDREINLCYPKISENGSIYIREGYDISLMIHKENIIPNDIILFPGEKAVFISGANGGGKTAFLRTVGICSIMFSCGLFIPADSGNFPVLDNIYTIFPQQERLYQAGRFENEKKMLENVIENITSSSLILLNELFSDTNEENGLSQFQIYLEKIENKGAFTFFVTHFLNVIKYYQDRNYPVFSCRMSEGSVTFKIIRDTKYSSSVHSILERYGLNKSRLIERCSERINDTHIK